MLLDDEILTCERRGVLDPYLDYDLNRLVEGAHVVARLRETVAMREPFVLVPTRDDAITRVEAPVAQEVHGRGNLGEQGGAAIAGLR